MPLIDPVLFLATVAPIESRKFYEDVLALPFVEEGPYALVFRVRELTLRIQKVHELTVAPYTVLGWKVDDIRSETRELKSRGVRFERYPGLEQDADGIWASPSGALVAWFKDPDGNTLSITQLPKEPK